MPAKPSVRHSTKQSLLKKSLLSMATISSLSLFSTLSFASTELTPTELAEQGLKAGANYSGLHSLCNIDKPLAFAGMKRKSGKKRTLTDEERKRRSAKAVIEPTQVFDNLYFVGNRKVASWAVTTSEGIILIDAMNSNGQAENIIVAGLKKLGLDPNDIKYLVIAHAHGDHYGGQEYLVNNFHPRVIMSDEDWTELEKPVQEINNPRWGKKPTRDISAHDGYELTLGDTSIELYVTPGHTLGTLSMIIPLKEGNNTHWAALWGGTGLNFGPNEPRIRQYSASAQRMKEIGEKKGVDVFLSNHPTRDNSTKRIAQLKERQADAPHPFVDDNALAAFDLLRDCSLAHAIKLHKALNKTASN
ncbi:MBL fold metallo-hydrolase [Marinomonas balearica]|uniref:Metallo-beta-lactamase class B n=1 Tax=Marinomonas balearica TaxID=491947 RepID=A0A4R6MI17_9GAMM|nr:MBL fold metallo-hydrolase [Marinomonas balearica]TDP00501.1 metallo-beta-lactamase class B [Marinomonas balearica]